MDDRKRAILRRIETKKIIEPPETDEKYKKNSIRLQVENVKLKRKLQDSARGMDELIRDYNNHKKEQEELIAQLMVRDHEIELLRFQLSKYSQTLDEKMIESDVKKKELPKSLKNTKEKKKLVKKDGKGRWNY